MERILTAFTLAEKDRLLWRRLLTGIYRSTGDWRVYMLFPSVILAEGDHFSTPVPVGDGIYSYGSEAVRSDLFTLLPLTGGAIPEYAENPGLFITAGNPPQYSFTGGSVEVKSLALIKVTGTGFRILRERPLRKGI